MRPRRRPILLALVGLPIFAAGCAFEGQIKLQTLGDAPVVVKQSAKVALIPHRVKGTTTRAGRS